MITPRALNELLSEAWPHGQVESVTAMRVGQEFGFGGQVYRLDAETSGGTRSLVAKKETPDQVARVVEAYRHMGEIMTGRVPRLYGWGGDITLFEFVSSVIQGDGLDIREWQIDPLICLLADLHSETWSSGESPWTPEHWDSHRWQTRIALAGDRYPDQMGDELRARLLALHQEMPTAIAAMREGPTALVHMDSGHDNTLWRPDGSVVLLDWSNARWGPPTLDLAAHLADGEPDGIIQTYLETLWGNGHGVTGAEIVTQLANTVRVFIRGMVEFAGLPGEPTPPRLRCFRDRALDVVRSMLGWLDDQPR